MANTTITVTPNNAAAQARIFDQYTKADGSRLIVAYVGVSQTGAIPVACIVCDTPALGVTSLAIS